MKNRQLIIPIASMMATTLALMPLPAQTSFTAPSSDTASGPVIPSTAEPTSPMTAPVTSPTPGAASVTTPSPGVTVSTTNGAPPHSVAYTVLKGDSLTKLASKFNTTRKHLESINDLASYKLSPGQVIYVPAPPKKTAAVAKKKHTVVAAVQDYDIPASTFASCPVPPSNGDDDSDMTSTYGKPAPIAALVSPSEMEADQAKQKADAAASAQADDAASQERLTATIAPPRLALPSSVTLSSSSTGTATTLKKAKLKVKTTTTVVTAAKPIAPASAPSGWANGSSRSQPQSSGMSRFWSSLTGSHLSNAGMDTPAFDPANEWGYKFLRQARALGDRGIDYNDDWRPPGENSSWVMDCSNTSRWLYKTVAGINLPRTASDQYYYLHQQGKAWDVPATDYGVPDVAYLQRNLRPGDLLFWENTYRPERQPPITHVMVFLGTNEHGQWIMAGSQSSGGEHGRRDGGPDVYVFRPSQPCGGYTSWFVHHRGRFCAFGRPLEADPSKLAAND